MVNMEKTFITPLNSLVSDTKVSGSFLYLRGRDMEAGEERKIKQL